MKPNIAEIQKEKELWIKQNKELVKRNVEYKERAEKAEAEVERQAEEIERLKQIIADANKEHEETLLGEALRRDTDAMR